jgi:hypothetical protein
VHRAYAALWGEVFAHPAVQAFLTAIAGAAVRMRVDLVRLSTGIDDTVDGFQLPHAWHRDSPGEFTFGLFFDDFTRPGSGGTAVLPGTHWMPFNPIWDFVLGSGRHYTSRANYLRDECVWLPEDLAEAAVVNREYQASLAASAVEIGGGPGDLYFFFNDLHHGRAPNRTGERLMASRFGGFSAAFPFKDDVARPAIPDWYPAALRHASAPKPPHARDASFLLGEMEERRRGGVLPHLARLEKRLLVREAEDRVAWSRQQQKIEALEAEVTALKNVLGTRPRRRWW